MTDDTSIRWTTVDPGTADNVICSCDSSGKVTFNWPLIAAKAADNRPGVVNVATFIAAAIEEAARLIDERWLASPGEYAEAIRALVKPPAV